MLEARWAVFFNNAGIPFEYEYLGYQLGELGRTWYLPDFWLPEQRTWVEVKPHSDFASADIKKITNFDQALRNEYQAEKAANEKPERHTFNIFVGSPYFNGKVHTYKVFRVEHDDLDKNVSYSVFYRPAESVSDLKIVNKPRYWIHCPLCERLSLDSIQRVRDIYGQVSEERVSCSYCNGSESESREGEVKRDKDGTHWARCEYFEVVTNRTGYILGSPRLMKGYKAAREFKAPRKRQ